MFMCLICFLHLLAILTVERNMSAVVHCMQTLEMLMFFYVLVQFVLHLSEFIFEIITFKCGRSMSLISLILQQSRKPICAMASSSDVIKPEVFDGACFALAD